MIYLLHNLRASVRGKSTSQVVRLPRLLVRNMRARATNLMNSLL